MFHSLRQDCELQLLDEVELPLHLPVTEHILLRVLVPPPHVRLQLPHDPHGFQVARILRVNVYNYMHNFNITNGSSNNSNKKNNEEEEEE